MSIQWADGGVKRVPPAKTLFASSAGSDKWRLSYIIKFGNIEKAPPIASTAPVSFLHHCKWARAAGQPRQVGVELPIRCLRDKLYRTVPLGSHGHRQCSHSAFSLVVVCLVTKKLSLSLFAFYRKKPLFPSHTPSYTMFSSRFIRPAASTFARATPRPLITNTPSIASRFFTTSSPKMTVHNIAT